MQPTEQSALADYNQTIQRCAEAYHQVKAQLRKGASSWSNDAQENQHKAYLAFSAHLPVLIDPASFQLYVACIAKGVAIGAIDVADAGRLCHIAQTAMSIWKLANLTIPAVQAKERAAQQKSEEKATLPPPKGNQLDDSVVEQALQQALHTLPSFDVQKQHFQVLRNRGQLLPSDSELRDNPLAALHLCREAQRILRQEALAEIATEPQPGPQPAPDKKEPSQQAA